MIDVVVAGGGPVGLAVAIHARLAGLSVVVVEPREGAIDKACGEGLMPDAVGRLASIGVDPPGLPFHGIRYLAGARQAEARFRHGPGRGVRRTTLHAALRARADAAGVDVHVGRVTDVAQTADGVTAAGITARYLVGADGLHSHVREAAGLSGAARGPRRFGVRRHFTVAPWTDLVEVHWLPDCEVYVTPVSDDVVGVAVLGRRPLGLSDAITALPALRDRLFGAEPASAERGAGPLRQATRARVAGRVLLAGDAAGYVDALTGEGLRVGLAEAEALAAALAAGEPQRYEREWAGITRSYRVLTGGLLWASGRPLLRRSIVPAAAAVPSAFRAVVDAIGG